MMMMHESNGWIDDMTTYVNSSKTWSPQPSTEYKGTWVFKITHCHYHKSCSIRVIVAILYLTTKLVFKVMHKWVIAPIKLDKWMSGHSNNDIKGKYEINLGNNK